MICKDGWLAMTTRWNIVWYIAGFYYKLEGPEKLAKFLEDAEIYVAPQAPYALPPPELLPRRRTAAEAKQMFPKPIELRGYCPVSFFEGKCRFVRFSKHIYRYSQVSLLIPRLFIVSVLWLPAVQENALLRRSRVDVGNMIIDNWNGDWPLC